MRTVIIMVGLLLVLVANAAEVGVDRVLPSIAELGTGWTSNRIVILLDPLSSPSQVVDSRDSVKPEAALQSLRDGMRKTARDAQALVRYYRGDHQYIVFVSRFDSKASAEANWAKAVEEEKSAALSLTRPIGERFHSSNRHGMHNDLSFLRGNYHITVECAMAHGWDEVKHLARAIDDRLLSQHKEEK